MTDIRCATLEEGDVRLRFLSLGCITQSWRIGGQEAVLGYADPRAYLHNPACMGAIVGRVANRIAGARFVLDGQIFHLPANEGPNTLHGGPAGLATRNWQMDRDGPRRLRFALVSPDGDQGFPGRLTLRVTVTLHRRRVTWDIFARPDRPTPVNLAQHNYYALGGDARDMRLRLDAGQITPTDAAMIPTGAILPAGPALDFRKPRTIGRPLDQNFVTSGANPRAEARGESFALSLRSDQPGLQVYTAQHLAPLHTALPGQQHRPYAALCLEPQAFPDAPNQPGFAPITATPDRPYRQRLSVTITPR